MMASPRPALELASVDPASPLGKRKYSFSGHKQPSNSYSFTTTRTFFENLNKKVKAAAHSSILPVQSPVYSPSQVSFSRSFDRRSSFSLGRTQTTEARDGMQPTGRWENMPTSQGRCHHNALKSAKSDGLPVYRAHQTPVTHSQDLHAARTPVISGATTTPLDRSAGLSTVILASLPREVHGPVPAVRRGHHEEYGLRGMQMSLVEEMTGRLAAPGWKSSGRAAQSESEEWKEGYELVHANTLHTEGQTGLFRKPRVPSPDQVVVKLQAAVSPLEARIKALEEENQAREEENREIKTENRQMKAKMKELEELTEYKKRVDAACRAATGAILPQEEKPKQTANPGDADVTKGMSYKERLLAKSAQEPINPGKDLQELRSAKKSAPVSVQGSLQSRWRTGVSGVRIDDDFRRKMASRDMEIEAVTSRLGSFALRREEKKKSSILYAPQLEEEEEQDSALVPLSPEADQVVDAALAEGNSDDILATHAKENIDVTRGLMRCLREGTWLNDEVINFYLALLKEREVADPEKHLRCHFFNTFFFAKLFRDKGQYEYKSVRRWTTPKKISYKLHECDKILVPIHLEVHWCLAVINIREKKFEYLDSLGAKPTSQIARCIFDSLAHYITDEAKDKAGVDLDVSDWERVVPKNIPNQENGCDCGVFMVKYADYHSRNAPLTFSQCNMPYFRRRMVWEIVQGKAL